MWRNPQGEPQPKRKKYLKSCESESDYVNVDVDLQCDGELDRVVLTPEEEEKFEEVAALYEHDNYDYELEEDDVEENRAEYEVSEEVHSGESSNLYSSDRRCTPAQESQGSYSEVAQRTVSVKPAVPQPQQARPHNNMNTTNQPSIRLSLPSHNIFLKFLLHKGELKHTCEWNNFPKKVYSLFNITRYIVHPNYLFASEQFPNHKVSTILTKLEKSPYLPWSYVSKQLKHFLDGFEGFENLADVLHVEELAHPLIVEFRACIQDASEREGIPQPGWYSNFLNFANSLLKEGGLNGESNFSGYVSALFAQLNGITNVGFPLITEEIKLVLPAQQSSPEKVRKVRPDFMVLAAASAIMLVGEVKNFGCRGVKFGEHKEHRVGKVQPGLSNIPDSRLTPQTKLDTDQPQGQGDQPPPIVNEKDKSFPSVTTDEPHASTCNEQTGSSTKGENPTMPVRCLNKKEKFKVDAYLPQLFGEMLAAMHANEMDDLDYRWSFKFCAKHENVLFGFAVEGLKLRFVKLTIIDLKKKLKPTVSALLGRYRQRFKCNIHMTQEFNLVNKHHLEMFYKVLLAMKYECRW